MTQPIEPSPHNNHTNVLGTALASCCFFPLTGYYRDGFCHTGIHDVSQHTVCTRVTAEFLQFSADRGNDLITPLPEFHFSGLIPGDFWCVCALRWIEALDYGVASPIKLEAHKHLHYGLKLSFKLTISLNTGLSGVCSLLSAIKYPSLSN